MAVRTLHFFSRIFTKTRLSKKQLLPVRRYHRALRKWQTGTAMTHLICYSFESKVEFSKKRSKKTMIFQKWFFSRKKSFSQKNWKCPKSMQIDRSKSYMLCRACLVVFMTSIWVCFWNPKNSTFGTKNSICGGPDVPKKFYIWHKKSKKKLWSRN